jgi:integrase
LVKFSGSSRAALVTGCRQDELAKATWSQLDLDAKRLTMIGKGRKTRAIDLVPLGGDEVLKAAAAVADRPGS